MFKSKRFVAFCVSVVLFTILLLYKDYQPLELAGAISVIVGVYIGAETVKRSDVK